MLKILINTKTRLREFDDPQWAKRYKVYLRSRNIEFQEFTFQESDLEAGRKLANLARIKSLQLGGDACSII